MLVATKSFETALHAVREALHKVALNSNTPIISAVSGGPDSLALALLLQQIAGETGRRHHSVIVDHGLRQDSKAEALAATQELARYGITSEIQTVQAAKPTGGIQEFARKHRLSILAAAGRAAGAIVCFGHHKQDQAETIYMRLAKGSGLSGLSGMPEQRMHKGCLFMRPILSVAPELLSQICVEADLTPVHDPSNQDRRFERVRARQHLQTEKHLTPKLLKLGANAAAIIRQFDATLFQQVRGHVFFNAPYGLSIKSDCYKHLPKRLRLRFLTLCLKEVGKGDYPARQDALSNLDLALIDGKKATLAGCLVMQRDRQFHFIREARHFAEPLILSDEMAGHIFDASWHITGKAGLRFVALGEAGYNRLPKTSAFRAFLARWPHPARLRFPVLMPLDVDGAAHHFKDMERWAKDPASLADLFTLRLIQADMRSISS